MKSYAGIDLHGTNSVIVVLDDDDRVRYQQRLRNELAEILAAFAPFRETLQGIAVESTYIIGIGWSMGSWTRGTSSTSPMSPRSRSIAASHTRTIITTRAGWRPSFG